MTPFIAEFLGTMLLILMGAGVVANVSLAKTKGNGAGWMAYDRMGLGSVYWCGGSRTL